MIWFGEKRGYASDWVTQLWVRLTGSRVVREQHPWLDAHAGNVHRIGRDWFRQIAEKSGLEVTEPPSGGIVPSLELLHGDEFNPGAVSPAVRRFYEHTAAYELDAWSHWAGLFRPFGWALAVLFSRRLQQLNVPLTGLDTSRGLTNVVWHLVTPETRDIRHIVWIRELLSTGDTVYAGSYSVCLPPSGGGPCLRVAFPLPNGNALVIMRPEGGPDGSLSLISRGRRFGDPGFYFTVHRDDGTMAVRYLSYLRESIHVYPDGQDVRADHLLEIWGLRFLRLHYRLRQSRPVG